MANDCSERACPSAFSHMPHKRGDMNMDGDENDNSFKELSQNVATLSSLSDTVTFAGNLLANEITAGDGIMIEGQKFIVASHTSGTNTLTLGEVHAAGITTGTPKAYRFLRTPVHKAGTWETWPGDAVSGEGHPYMECAGRGNCNRRTGVCKCFPGYEGSACQRTLCPRACSGHGTCEDIEGLRNANPVFIDGYECFGARGSHTIYSFGDMTSLLSSGTVIRFENFPDTFTVSTVTVAAATSSAPQGTTVTLTSVLPFAVPLGTRVYKLPQYELFDKHMNRACVCDPQYSGFDCSHRECPKGDDPLTRGQHWETQAVTLGSQDPNNALSGHFRLIFTDMYGGKWNTALIPVEGATDYKQHVRQALAGLPDDVVEDVIVSSQAIGTKSIQYRVRFNGGEKLVATGNSGDIAAMGCDTSLTTVRMEATLRDAGDTADAAIQYQTLNDVGLNGETEGTDVVYLSAAHSTGTITDLADGDTVALGAEMRVVKGNGGSILSTATQFKVDRPFSKVSGVALKRVGTAGTDYTRSLAFTSATHVSAEAVVPGTILRVGSVEERTVATVTLTSGSVSSVTLTEPWTLSGASGSHTLYSARYLPDAVDCEVTDVFGLRPSSWTGQYVTGHTAMTGAVNLQDSGGTTLTATTTVGSADVAMSGVVANAGAIAVGYTVRIGGELRVVASAYTSSPSKFTVDRPWTVASTNAAIEAKGADITRLLTFSAAVNNGALSIAPNDRLKIYHSTDADWPSPELVTVSSVASDGLSVTTTEQMNHHSLNSGVGSSVFFYGRGSRESAECSNRGLCERSTGMCKCFKGYTMNDCSVQKNF